MIKRHAANHPLHRNVRSRDSFGSPAYLETLEPRQMMAADLFGNTPATAEIVAGTLGSSQVTFADAVSATDTKDFFKVHLGADQILNASLTGLSANANLRVYNMAGELVASSANAGTASENIKVALAQNTDYYVLVCRGTGETNYTLKLSASAAVADGAGNSRGRSADLGTLTSGGTTTRSDYVGEVDGQDYYRFTVDSLSKLTLNLSGLAAGSDADIELINSSGYVIASSSQRGNGAESINTMLIADTYYIRVYRYAGGSNYTLSVKADKVDDACGNTLSVALDAGAVTSNTATYQDSLSIFDPCDYYTFVVAGESKINLSLTGLSGDATLKLLDQTGKVVEYSAKGGTASESIATSVAAGVYYIRISIASGETSYTLTASATPSAQAPVLSTGNGSINQIGSGSYREIDVRGTSGNDLIVISAEANSLIVTINDHKSTYTITSGGVSLDEIAVWGGTGNDTIVVTSSVTLNCRVYAGGGDDMVVGRAKGRMTLVSIGGGTDTLIGNVSDTSFWFDASDGARTSAADVAAGRVHKVESFYQPYTTNQAMPEYVPLELSGQDLVDPTPTDPMFGSGTLSFRPLWGDGPTLEDINQGALGDCYFLAGIGGLAKFQPAELMERAVDLGDGTYAVQFTRNGVNSYVRVDGDIVTNFGDFAYNAARSGGPIWACIMEKAYAFYRQTGANSYASIEGGYPNATLMDFGFDARRTDPRSNAYTTFDTISEALAKNQTVLLGTYWVMPDGVPLVKSHAYTVLSASRDGAGNMTYTVRNPWGWDGRNPDTGELIISGDPSDGIITLTAAQLAEGCNCLVWIA